MIPKSWYSSISERLWASSPELALAPENKTESQSPLVHKGATDLVPSTSQEARASIKQVVSDNFRTSSNDETTPAEPPPDRASWFSNLPRNFDLSRISNQVLYRQEPIPPAPPIEQSTSQTHPTFSAAHHYIEIDVYLPMHKKQIADMLLHSAIAKSAYRGYEDLMLKAERFLKNNPTLERTTWQAIDLPEELQNQFGLEKLGDNRYLHNDSHLVALFLMNAAEKKFVISFGGTSSGKNTGRLIYRLVSNTTTTFNQWKRNFHSAGFHMLKEDVPDCYIVAAKIAGQIQKLIAEDPRYAGYKLTITGHSKGGAEAAYATLNHPSIPAFCFATPPLGKRLLNTISPENKALAKENIHHYFVKYDVIPSIDTTLKPILETSHVGKGYWLPAPAHIVSGPFFPIWAHVSFHECITDHAEIHFHTATDPIEVIENDKNTTIETDVMSEEEIAMIDDDNFEARLFEMQQRILW